MENRRNKLLRCEGHGRDLEALRPIVHNRNEIVLAPQQIYKAVSHGGPIIALSDEEAFIEALKNKRNSANIHTSTFSIVHEIQIFEADQNKTAEYRNKRTFDRALLTEAEEISPIAPGRPVDNSYAEHSVLSNALHLRQPAGLEASQHHNAKFSRLHGEQLPRTTDAGWRCRSGRPIYPERLRTQSFDERNSFCTSVLAPKSSTPRHTGEEQTAHEYKRTPSPRMGENQHGNHELEGQSTSRDSVNSLLSKDRIFSQPSVGLFGFSATVNHFEAAYLDVPDDGAGRFALEPPALSNRNHRTFQSNTEAKGRRVADQPSANPPYVLVDLEQVAIQNNKEIECKSSYGAKLPNNQGSHANGTSTEYDHQDTQHPLGLATNPLNCQASPYQTQIHPLRIERELQTANHSEIRVERVDLELISLPALVSRCNPISVTLQQDIVPQQGIISTKYNEKPSNSVGLETTLEMLVPPISEVMKDSTALGNQGALSDEDET
jgi:hypothetical protein